MHRSQDDVDAATPLLDQTRTITSEKAAYFDSEIPSLQLSDNFHIRKQCAIWVLGRMLMMS